jgi:hypothetical protein
LDKEQEKWAIFWCDLLSPVIYRDIEAELTNQFLKATANEQILFPDGRFGKPINQLNDEIKWLNMSSKPDKECEERGGIILVFEIITNSIYCKTSNIRESNKLEANLEHIFNLTDL